MTKIEFCEKWRFGWKKMYHDGTQAYFFTEEQMLNDLDRVINTAYAEWENYVEKRQAPIRINLCNEWQLKEAEAIQERR